MRSECAHQTMTEVARYEASMQMLPLSRDYDALRWTYYPLCWIETWVRNRETKR
jgi:hypothetical protein